jgi:DNA-binding MarR family transcriptional regulator
MKTDVPVRALTPAIEDFGWTLGAVFRAYYCALGEAVGDFPHGPRGYQVLHTVVHCDQPSQLALATRLGIDRTVMTYLIDDLITAGFVERRLNPADRRQRKVVSTEAGVHALDELERRVRQAQDSVLAPLQPDERETLCALFSRVANSVDTRENPYETIGSSPQNAGAASH